jgi:hypothetical protein
MFMSDVHVFMQAVALARRYLKTNKQDIACLVASGRKVMPPEDDTTAAAAGDAGSLAATTAPAASAAAGAGAVWGASKYPALCHRLIVLECEPGRPRSLLVSGVSPCILRTFTVLDCIEGTVLYCTVLYCTVLYCIMRRLRGGGVSVVVAQQHGGKRRLLGLQLGLRGQYGVPASIRRCVTGCLCSSVSRGGHGHCW